LARVRCKDCSTSKEVVRVPEELIAYFLWALFGWATSRHFRLYEGFTKEQEVNTFSQETAGVSCKVELTAERWLEARREYLTCLLGPSTLAGTKMTMARHRLTRTGTSEVTEAGRSRLHLPASV
jgi:hypothetical protein